MLDLLTLAASMGLQGDLEKIRAERGECMEPEQEQTLSGPLGVVVDAVSAGLEAVENSVSAVANVMLPTTSMVEAVMPASVAPEVDLSLPVEAKKTE